MATLMMKYGVISADDHVQEAPDVWTNRMSKAKFGDEIPHIVDLPDGSQTWALGGNSQGFGGLARIAGVKKLRCEPGTRCPVLRTSLPSV